MGLFFIGNYAQKRFGWWLTLIIFLVTGFIESYITDPLFAAMFPKKVEQLFGVTVGASGGIFGLIGASLAAILFDIKTFKQIKQPTVIVSAIYGISVTYAIDLGYNTVCHNVAFVLRLVVGTLIIAPFFILKKRKVGGDMDIYKQCPQLGDDKFELRPVQKGDADALLRVYSDDAAVPLFNSDNCHGDDFHYTTHERMAQALEFWITAYDNGWFVRFAVVDKAIGEPIGTIELFRREAEDYFTDCALLRLDLLSDYERAEAIEHIVSIAASSAFELFGCGMLATKAIPAAAERISALNSLGFARSDEPLIGHDNTKYYDYFVLRAPTAKDNIGA